MDIDRSALDIATNRIRIEYRDRERSLRADVEKIKGEMVKRGVLHSGMTVSAIRNVVRREYEVRGMLAWEIIARVMSGLTPTENSKELESRVKQVVADRLAKDCPDLIKEYDFIDRIGVGSKQPIDELRQEALDKVYSEIDIAFLHLKRSHDQSGGGTVVNIYQPLGIVQTGPGANASLSQHFRIEEREALASALERVLEVVSFAEELSPNERKNLAEVVSDGIEEARKPDPNMLKLRMSVGGAATAVQTLGSASAAYQAVKSAAALVGIPLP